jgi:hypothetical protein
VGDEGLTGATTVPERATKDYSILYSSTVLFWLFREINGDKVATNIILVFKSADN